MLQPSGGKQGTDFLACSLRRGEKAGLLYGVRGQARERWLWWSTHPWWCRVQGSCTGPCFCSDISQVAVGFVIFLLLVIYNFTQLYRRGFIFSPFTFLCVSLLGEMFVCAGTAAKVPGPQSQPISDGRDTRASGRVVKGGQMLAKLTEGGCSTSGSAVSSSWPK